MKALLALVVVLAMPLQAHAKGRTNPLTWKLSRHGGKLAVDITFHNATRKTIYLAKELVTTAPGPGSRFTRSDRLTVMNSDVPGVARIVLGAVSSDRPAHRLYEPTAEPVAPGATVTRHFELPLPLTSWHPLGGAHPLSPATRRAKLTVFGFAGKLRWETLPSDDKEPIRIPEIDRAPMIFEGATLPLPAAP